MWAITSSAGDAFRARYVVMNFGTFTQAKLPKVEGVASFEGEMFHTSRWNYDYTGCAANFPRFENVLPSPKRAVCCAGVTARATCTSSRTSASR